MQGSWEVEEVTAGPSGSVGKSTSEVGDIQAKRPRLDSSRRCFWCGLPGHQIQDCRKTMDSSKALRMEPSTPSGSATQSVAVAENEMPQRTPVVCYACGKPGHIASRCPKKEEKRGAEYRVDICTLKPAIISAEFR